MSPKIKAALALGAVAAIMIALGAMLGAALSDEQYGKVVP